MDDTKLFYDEFSGRYFLASVDQLFEACAKLNEQLTNGKAVTAFELYAELGLVEDTYLERQLHPELTEWGWTEGKGYHKLTQQELHPDACPCCGRPWPV